MNTPIVPGRPRPTEAQREAMLLIKAIQDRRRSLRTKGFSEEATPFGDGIETYVFKHEHPDFEPETFRDLGVKLAQHVQGQLLQDLWVLTETKEKRDGYFVEFGATNGTTMSNTLLLERRYDWTGIVAEPNPTYHERLHQTRKCNISTKCVHSETGAAVEFLCAERSMMSRMAIAETGDELDDDAVAERVMVETITLDDLLDSFDAPDTIDFLSVDTEGSEYDILSAFDFSRRRINLMAVEHNYGPRRGDIQELMFKNGFVLRAPTVSRFDDWYMHSSLL